MFESAAIRMSHQEKPVRPESEFRRLVLERLEQLGVIERRERQVIVDIDRLRTGLIKQIREKADLGKEDCDVYFQHGQPELFYTIFRDVRVVSKQDWEREGLKAKPKKLFYTPETAENALDPHKIRTQDFYLGLWETLPVNQSVREALYPSRHEHLRMSEVAIAALLYHPKFGDGSRDQTGRLQVRDPKTGEKKPIQGHWFSQIGYTGGANNEFGGSLKTPREYLTRHASEIIKRGLLRLDDFRATTAMDSHERPAERFKLSAKGVVMLHGVLHTLGRPYAKYRVKELSSGVGALLESGPDGSDEIHYTFTIFKPGDPRLKKVKFGSDAEREAAGVGLTDVQPYRGMEMVGMEHIKKADAFWRELQVNFAGIAPEEQTRLAKAIEGLDRLTRGRLKLFAKRFGMEGVRAFLSAEADAKQGRRILSLVDQLGEPVARSVFRKYNELLDLTKKETDEITQWVFRSGSTQNLDRSRLNKEFVARATQALLAFEEKAQTHKKRHFYAEDLMRDLDRHQKDLVLFASVCKTIGKEKDGGIKFEDLRGVEYLSDLMPADLSEQDRMDIRTVMRMNWIDQNKRAGEMFKGVLEEKMNPQNTTTRFTLLKKDGQVMAFIRFDERPDFGEKALYGGSFNVHPAFRGSAIGSALMRQTINEKARAGFVLHAHVVPDALIGTSYVEDMGHIITNVDETKSDEKGKRAPLLKILRDDQLVFRSRAVGLTPERLMENRVSGVRMFRFDLSDEKKAFLATIQQAVKQGKIVSRYFSDPKNPRVRWIAVESDPRISTDIQIALDARRQLKSPR